MNASQFLDLIHRSDQLEKADFLQLRKVQENFPYFQISHVLAARYDALKNPEKKTPNLALAALTSPNRIWLKEFIEKPVEGNSTTERKVKEDLLPEEVNPPKDQIQRTESLVKLGEQLKGVKPEEKPEVKPKAKKRKPPKDDLIESIKKKEKKDIPASKTREQIDLIKAFSKKEIKLATIKEIEANQNTENLAEPSTKFNENLITETFAKILIQQGKKDMAMEIYEKLSLKFPDKRTYFADLIEKLKE
ncbi:hypothetical protein DFQ04_1364 [Algoriphagus boseongensis]|uniref:Tetratricopeptide repeat protein n=1 Tax=Algoriphagus boseongensis TaxID=1442587 RepID=A0A4R6T9S8_9BACT|nr:hypothetical protein [Algoriphagus boseongensis]TDQ19541.1 hypothetical protein DFQ04_1364 [Algoriphagus boseongensis]